MMLHSIWVAIRAFDVYNTGDFNSRPHEDYKEDLRTSISNLETATEAWCKLNSIKKDQVKIESPNSEEKEQTSAPEGEPLSDLDIALLANKSIMAELDKVRLQWAALSRERREAWEVLEDLPIDNETLKDGIVKALSRTPEAGSPGLRAELIEAAAILKLVADGLDVSDQRNDARRLAKSIWKSNWGDAPAAPAPHGLDGFEAYWAQELREENSEFLKDGRIKYAVKKAWNYRLSTAFFEPVGPDAPAFNKALQNLDTAMIESEIRVPAQYTKADVLEALRNLRSAVLDCRNTGVIRQGPAPAGDQYCGTHGIHSPCYKCPATPAAQAPIETGFSVVMRDESFRQAKEAAAHITRITRDSGVLAAANKIFETCREALGDQREAGAAAQVLELESLERAAELALLYLTNGRIQWTGKDVGLVVDLICDYFRANNKQGKIDEILSQGEAKGETPNPHEEVLRDAFERGRNVDPYDLRVALATLGQGETPKAHQLVHLLREVEEDGESVNLGTEAVTKTFNRGKWPKILALMNQIEAPKAAEGGDRG